jgi:osmotically-inducible protein OsmY
MKTDEQIQKDVMEEISWEPQLDATEIGVAVHNGVVTLSGNVNTYLKKLAAERAAKRVKGVLGVAMDIEVRLGIDNQRNDTEIATAAVQALKWHTSVPEDKIRVAVEDGWITLEGQVRWQYQKTAAVDAVHSLTGEKGETNLITIMQTVDTAAIKDKIRKALERNADVEASRIKVEASGNKVVLRGKVNSWNERRIVENVAWATPGVTAVEDDLLIGK